MSATTTSEDMGNENNAVDTVMNLLRHRILGMQEAAYTFGDCSKEAVSAALDGVLDVIDELVTEMREPQSAAPQLDVSAQEADNGDDEEEESEADGWRRLALQFDNHRIELLGCLRAMVSDPAKHMEAAKKLLSAPPLGGEVVLAERIAALAPAMFASRPAIESWAVRYGKMRKFGSPDDQGMRFEAMHAEINEWRSCVMVDTTSIHALIDYCDNYCRDVSQTMIDKARASFLVARACQLPKHTDTDACHA